jgi:small subunit ribosomal protein S36
MTSLETSEPTASGRLAPAPDERALEERGRRIPGVIWLITALFFVLLLIYATLLPTWRAPDEPQHVDLVLYVADHYDYPRFDGRVVDPGIIASLRVVHAGSGSKHLAGADAPPRSSRPSFAELAQDPPTSVRRTRNQQPQHPPLYYITVAAGWRVVRAVVPGDALTSFDRQVWVLRALSAMFVVPVPLLAWAVSRRIGLPATGAMVAALVPLAIPQLTHVGSAVTNDAPMALLGGLTLLFALRLSAGDDAPRNAVLAGLFAGLGLLTKGFAFAFVLYALLAVIVGARVAGGRAALRAGAIVIAAAFVGGGWWWVRNVVFFHKLSPKGVYVSGRQGFDPDWGRWASVFSRAIFRRFWGHFGLYDIALPSIVWVPAAVTCAGLAAAALLRGPRLRPPGERRAFRGLLLVLLVPALALFAFIGIQALITYRRLGNIAFVQGRYLFGVLIGCAALVAIGVSTLGRRASRAAPIVVLFAAALLQTVAITRILGHYWGAPDVSLASRLRALLEWAPWASWFFVLLALAGLASATALAVALGIDAVRARPRRAETSAGSSAGSVVSP